MIVKSVGKLVCACSVLALSTMAMPSQTQAAPQQVTWNIVMGTGPSFTHSWIHTALTHTHTFAPTGTGDGQYYAGGNRTFAVTGDLIAIWNPAAGDGKFTFQPSTLNLTLNSTFNAPGWVTNDGSIYTMDITGGMMTDTNDTPPGTGAVANGADGFISYQLKKNGVAEESGSWVFKDLPFSGTPNNINPIEILSLWGNNWDADDTTKSAFVKSGGTAWGIDLGGNVGSTQVVPVPMAVWGGLIMLGSMGGLRLRRRHAQ